MKRREWEEALEAAEMDWQETRACCDALEAAVACEALASLARDAIEAETLRLIAANWRRTAGQ